MLVFFNVSGQKNLFIKSTDVDCEINLASEKINNSFIPPPIVNDLKSAGENKSQFELIYVNVPEYAKNAFQYAASIWENLILSNVPIRVKITWDALENNVLAKTRPSLHFRAIAGALNSDIYYPVALAEKITGLEMNEKEPDIICTFNKDISWYFGTDGKTPSDKYDLVTAVLHEIVHGIGFSGFLKDNKVYGYFDNYSSLPSIYDYLIFNGLNQHISDKSLFKSPSAELHNQLTSNNLKLASPNNDGSFNKDLAWIHAPSTWEEGISIYHLKSNSSSCLLSESTCKGQAVHSPDENIMKILSEMGWKSISYDFEKIKDLEGPYELLPVEIRVNSDFELDTATIKIYYILNNSSSINSVSLKYDPAKNKFSGNIPLNFYQGKVEYYFNVRTLANKSYSYPANSPEQKLSFNIGSDYYPPTLKHNPEKIISNSASLKLVAFATDNVGVNNVTVEYKLNGVTQSPLTLTNDSVSRYTGKIILPNSVHENDKIEYRIVAEDVSVLKNKSATPAVGFYQVIIFEPDYPVKTYSQDFNSATNDFAMYAFSISGSTGFSNGFLQTKHPYQISDIDNEYCNLAAILKHPVILTKDGKMQFDEIVLVEPGEDGASYTDQIFWDYVIVEGSKDNGLTWKPFSEGYDSQIRDAWKSQFLSTIINNTSLVSGQKEMFSQHTINLTENNSFNAGDTVLVRFRLASDNTINGWGWAIDNLVIQALSTKNNENQSFGNTHIYPNPFNDKIFVECSELNSNQSAVIRIMDISGKTVFSEVVNDLLSGSKKQLDLSNIEPGVYILNITTESDKIVTKKLIKNRM